MPTTHERTTGDFAVDRSVYWSLLQKVTAAIKDRGLPGIPEDHIFHGNVSSVKGKYPGCVVSATTELFPDQQGSLGTTDTIYGVLIGIVRASSRSNDGSTQHAAQLLDWRQRVVDLFYGGRPPFQIPGACHVLTQIVNGSPLLAEQWQRQLDAQFLSLRFTYRRNLRAI